MVLMETMWMVSDSITIVDGGQFGHGGGVNENSVDGYQSGHSSSIGITGWPW